MLENLERDTAEAQVVEPSCTAGTNRDERRVLACLQVSNDLGRPTVLNHNASGYPGGL